MATHHSNRPSAYSKRPPPPYGRSSKPASLSSKRTNSHAASKAGSRATHPKEEDFEDEDSMATSFLQYCTTCEKQIIVPNNSVLYCSESCRKKDDEKAVTYPIEHSPPMTPMSTFTTDTNHFRDIVPPYSPTTPPSKRTSMVLSELSTDDNAAGPPSLDDTPRRPDSEASRYLRQFQSATAAHDPSVRPANRPLLNRASVSQTTYGSAAPSLSHTPASSLSYSMPYTPSTTRPLPPRTNPHISSYGSRSIDLVTPCSAASASNSSVARSSPPSYSLKSGPVETAMSVGVVVEGEISYEKREPLVSVVPAHGSLKRLFAGTAPRWG